MPRFRLGTGYAIPFESMRGQEYVEPTHDLNDLRTELREKLETFNSLKEDIKKDPDNTLLKDTMFELGDKVQILQMRLDLIEEYLKGAILQW